MKECNIVVDVYALIRNSTQQSPYIHIYSQLNLKPNSYSLSHTRFNTTVEGEVYDDDDLWQLLKLRVFTKRIDHKGLYLLPRTALVIRLGKISYTTSSVRLCRRLVLLQFSCIWKLSEITSLLLRQQNLEIALSFRAASVYNTIVFVFGEKLYMCGFV